MILSAPLPLIASTGVVEAAPYVRRVPPGPSPSIVICLLSSYENWPENVPLPISTVFDGVGLEFLAASSAAWTPGSVTPPAATQL